MSNSKMVVTVYNHLGTKYGKKTIEISDNGKKQGYLKPGAKPKVMENTDPIQDVTIAIIKPYENSPDTPVPIPISINSDHSFTAALRFNATQATWNIMMDVIETDDANDTSGEKTTRTNVTVGSDEPGDTEQ